MNNEEVKKLFFELLNEWYSADTTLIYTTEGNDLEEVLEETESQKKSYEKRIQKLLN